MRIPFNRPWVPPSSKTYIRESLDVGLLSGSGPMVERASQALMKLTKSQSILLTPSCTHALELACRLLDLKPGDEVIVPSFNFPSAATAVALTGATPVFVDVDKHSKNLTPEAVESALTSRTRAVIVLHYGGYSAPAAEIQRVADSVDAIVIEDAAHGLGFVAGGAPLGSVGAFTTYSFHETKNIQCGEGGALQINDARFVDRAQILREKGTNRRQYFAGQVEKYSWVDHGSSWLLADPLAALLLGQLEHFESIQARRSFVHQQYRLGLSEWAEREAFELSGDSQTDASAAHLFAIVAPSTEIRSKFIAFLECRSINATFHYQPLHSSIAGQKLGRTGDCPMSTLLGERLVRLPIFFGMTDDEIAWVINSVRSFRSS